MFPIWTEVIGILPAQSFAHANIDLPKEHLPHPKGSSPNIPAITVEGQETLSVTAHSHDVSIQCRQPLKYKMATILAPNPMLSPEEIFVGIIKQHAVMMSR